MAEKIKPPEKGEASAKLHTCHLLQSEYDYGVSKVKKIKRRHYCEQKQRVNNYSKSNRK